jgi:hypothetical protein
MKSISEILKEANNIDNAEKRREFLLRNDSETLRGIMVLCFNPNIKFLIPSEPAPYKPSEFLDLQGRLHQEMKRFYIYLEGGNPGLQQFKREKIYVEMLESIDPADAALVESIKNKVMPYKRITRKFVEKVWPGMIPNE